MIKFFRKIRQRMLTENKFSKYLIYVIGEILLVVIGILIALHINNNNIKNQNSELEQEYLVALKSEFELNQDKIKKSLEGAENLDASLQKALSYFDFAVLDTLSDYNCAKILFEVSGGHFSRFEPVNAVLSDIINSGKLGIIKNYELRQSIATFNSDMELLKTQMAAIISSQQEIQDYIKENGSLKKILESLNPNNTLNPASNKIENKNIFKSMKFENYILDFLLSNSVIGQDYYPRINKSIENILKEVQQDIRNEG